MAEDRARQLHGIGEYMGSTFLTASAATMRALLSALAAAQLDAVRYRWIRNDCDYMSENRLKNGDELKCKESLDAAIDAAIAEREEA